MHCRDDGQRGTVLIGVEEDKDTRVAVEIRPIQLAGVEERLRQIAASHIAPVPDFEVHCIASPTDGTVGVVAVAVPPSSLAPHQWEGRYPFRRGTTTDYLDEKTVERLYQQRRDLSGPAPKSGQLLAEDFTTVLNGVELTGRFAVDSLGRAWTWRRSLLVRRNATVDLRVCDLRETQTLPDGNNYEQQVVAINQLNCFVITPASFRTSRASPQTRYVRLLEGHVWESYLRRATDLRRSAKLVINYWRSEGEVNTLNEFRAFLDLRREGWTELLAMFTLALMAVLAGVALLSAPAELAESPVVKFAETSGV